MQGTTEGTRRGPSPGSALLWIALAAACVSGLFYLRSSWFTRFGAESLASLNASQSGQAHEDRVLSLFQASFFFYYDDQFLPGIKQVVEDGAKDRLHSVHVLDGSGKVLFDSTSPKDSREHPDSLVPPVETQEFKGALKRTEPSVFRHGFHLQIIVPAPAPAGETPGYAVVYDFDASFIKQRLLGLAALGLALLGIAYRLASGGLGRRLAFGATTLWRRFWRLKAKFLLTIFAINTITALIVFWSLSKLQTVEQRARLEKDSALFARFSTAQVVSRYEDLFYFSPEQFRPEIEKIIASNENLARIRIIGSMLGDGVIFDSEQAALLASPRQPSGTYRGEFPAAVADIEEQLKTKEVGIQAVKRGGQDHLLVVNAFRNDADEVMYKIEYLFSLQSLQKSVAAIRRQILIDLVPSTLLGLFIAIVFAQVLLEPIRRLVAALRKVAAGNYDVSVAEDRSDEIGELVGAFNGMTQELRRKRELRKYLSDSTYRQIMEAPDSPEGVKIGGSRVEATILFCDIRDFVSHCENLEAEEVTTMLNEYFSEMVEVVHKNGGEVDKFIGDAMLAVFYSADESSIYRPTESGPRAPSSAATALQAIYCAMEMRERLTEYNSRRRVAGKTELDIGVGISHGEIIWGPIGSKDRMDFTVIGDVVNLASRIEKMSKLGQYTKIVFSDHVESKVRSLLDYKELTSEGGIRGKDEPVRVFELVGIRDLAALVANLKDQDPMVRRRSVELLGQSRNIEALTPVLGALDDRDEDVRLNAAVAVGKLTPRDLAAPIDALFAVLRRESSEKVVPTVIAVLGKVCGTERILDLEAFLESSNERVVANAIEAIGQVRSPRASDMIVPKLGSRNNRVKANAAMALFASGHLEVVDTLKPMLMHSDPLMRSSAAFALGELTLIAAQESLAGRWKTQPGRVKLFLAELQECVPMLVTLLRDPEVIVKRQAVLALGKIRDRSSVLPLLDMIEPEKDSKDLLREISHALRSIGSHRLVREVIERLS